MCLEGAEVAGVFWVPHKGRGRQGNRWKRSLNSVHTACFSQFTWDYDSGSADRKSGMQTWHLERISWIQPLHRLLSKPLFPVIVHWPQRPATSLSWDPGRRLGLPQGWRTEVQGSATKRLLGLRGDTPSCVDTAASAQGPPWSVRDYILVPSMRCRTDLSRLFWGGWYLSFTI